MGFHARGQVPEGDFVPGKRNVSGCERASAQIGGQKIGQRVDGRSDELAVQHISR